jgi:hypothetical protein
VEVGLAPGVCRLESGRYLGTGSWDLDLPRGRLALATIRGSRCEVQSTRLVRPPARSGLFHLLSPAYCFGPFTKQSRGQSAKRSGAGEEAQHSIGYIARTTTFRPLCLSLASVGEGRTQDRDRDDDSLQMPCQAWPCSFPFIFGCGTSNVCGTQVD